MDAFFRDRVISFEKNVAVFEVVHCYSDSAFEGWSLGIVFVDGAPAAIPVNQLLKRGWGGIDGEGDQKLELLYLLPTMMIV